MKKLLYTLLLALSAATGTYGVEKPNYANMLNEGTSLLQEGKFEEAKKIFIELTDQDSDKSSRAIALYHLGTIAEEQDNNTLAVKYYTKATDQTTNIPVKYVAMNNLAILYIKLNQLKKAEPLLLQLSIQNNNIKLKKISRMRLKFLRAELNNK